LISRFQKLPLITAFKIGTSSNVQPENRPTGGGQAAICNARCFKTKECFKPKAGLVGTPFEIQLQMDCRLIAS
jgi:hypothetical protein